MSEEGSKPRRWSGFKDWGCFVFWMFQGKGRTGAKHPRGTHVTGNHREVTGQPVYVGGRVGHFWLRSLRAGGGLPCSRKAV
jgi:hypothetical protein